MKENSPWVDRMLVPAFLLLFPFLPVEARIRIAPLFVAAAGWAAWRAAPGEGIARAILSIALLVAGALGLACAGCFRPLPFALLAACVSATSRPRSPIPDRIEIPIHTIPLGVTFAFFSIRWLPRPSLWAYLDPPAVSDSVYYHLPNVAAIVRTGSWASVPGTAETTFYQSLSWFQWAILLLPAPETDFWMKFLLVPLSVGVLWATDEVGEEMGLAVTPRRLALAVLASLPFLQGKIVATYQGNDLHFAFYSLAALALLARSIRAGRTADLAAGGAALGLALSSKPSAYPLSLPLLGLFVWALYAARSGTARGIAIAGLLVLGGAPAAKNLWMYGNPLYPVRIPGFEGPLADPWGAYGIYRQKFGIPEYLFSPYEFGGVFPFFFAVAGVFLIRISWRSSDGLGRFLLLFPWIYLLISRASPNHEPRFLFPAMCVAALYPAGLAGRFLRDTYDAPPVRVSSWVPIFAAAGFVAVGAAWGVDSYHRERWERMSESARAIEAEFGPNETILIAGYPALYLLAGRVPLRRVVEIPARGPVPRDPESTPSAPHPYRLHHGPGGIAPEALEDAIAAWTAHGVLLSGATDFDTEARVMEGAGRLRRVRGDSEFRLYRVP